MGCPCRLTWWTRKAHRNLIIYYTRPTHVDLIIAVNPKETNANHKTILRGIICTTYYQTLDVPDFERLVVSGSDISTKQTSSFSKDSTVKVTLRMMACDLDRTWEGVLLDLCGVSNCALLLLSRFGVFGLPLDESLALVPRSLGNTRRRTRRNDGMQVQMMPKLISMVDHIVKLWYSHVGFFDRVPKSTRDLRRRMLTTVTLSSS